jgi:nitroreductase
MHLNLTADQVLTTTRSVRKRLDFERPVERQIVMECLNVALQAPTGSNSQGWQWMFVEDDAKKQAIAEIYAANFFEYANAPRPAYPDNDPRAGRADAVKSSATYLAEHMAEAPILLIPCLADRPDGHASTAGYWGSILPAVWSFMLALRERGMGSAWTTLHLPNGGEQKTADLLGIPFDQYSQAGLFPIAYTKGTDFKLASRIPAAELSHWDTW